MDSQNTSFSRPPSAIDPDEARRRFLASMGIGDPEPEAPAKPVQEEWELEENDEEVALSSSPDDLELPGAPKSSSARGCVISYEVKPGTADKEPQAEAENKIPADEPGILESEEALKATEMEEAVEHPAPDHHTEEMNEKEVVNETPSAKVEASPAEESQPMSESTADIEGPLQLSCPKCKGDLVLMPEHIGIEGACVWCETKIVAARSGTDGEVRVFPLFQPDSLKPLAEVISEPSPEPKTVEPISEVPQEVTEVVSREEMDPSPEFAETAEAGFETVPEKEGPATESASAMEAAAPEWSGGFETPAAPIAEHGEEPSPSPAVGSGDLPSGFGDAAAPQLAPETGEGFAESVPSGFEDLTASSGGKSDSTLDAAVSDAVAGMPSGFGEPAGFSSALTAPSTQDDEPAPDSGSQVSAAAGFADGFSADPFASAMPPSVDAKEESAEAEAPAGFSEGWGEAPSSDGAPANLGGSPFSDAAFVESETPGSPGPKAGESAGAEAPDGFSGASSWGPPAASGANDSSPAPEKDEAPKSLEEPHGFQSGINAASQKEAKPFAETGEPLWGSAEKAPASLEDAPAPLDPGSGSFSEVKPLARDEDAPPSAFGETASEFGSGFAISDSGNGSFPFAPAPSTDDADSIFSDATNTDEAVSDEIASWGSGPGAEVASTEPLVEDGGKESDRTPVSNPEPKPQLFAAAPSNDTGGSIFGNQNGAKAGPPPIPGATPAAEPSGNGLFSGTPTVTSQSLGAKAAKKKGRALIVFLVILLGFVCGAALASFVLPVDEYVEKARAFMEQKLNMESGVDPALFLSELVAPGTESAAPQFPSGPEAANASAGVQGPESASIPEPAPAPGNPVDAPVEAPVTP